MWLNSGASEGYSIPLTESSLFAPNYLYKTNWGECGGLFSSFFFFFAFCIVDFGRENIRLFLCVVTKFSKKYIWKIKYSTILLFYYCSLFFLIIFKVFYRTFIL